ncbi:MAG: succinylglutamate desuccinylase/aspartoacylase family protein [Bacteroidota bacterium]
MRRLIGEHTGVPSGPLVIVFGATHGNEPAGVLAIQEVLNMLAIEPRVNPGFQFAGKFVGLIGNLQAYLSGQRFLKSDLNRQWTTENIDRIQHEPKGLEAEDAEISELLDLIHAEIRQNKPEALIFLDLHTTSAEGGIFCIPTDDESSLRLAKTLHAPVILGLFEGIEGTLLNYATSGNHFQVDGYPKHTLGAAFESGQHEDPLSVSRAISAIISCLRACGCIRAEDVDNKHDAILKKYSDQLPKVTRLRYVHKIRPEDAFEMRPGYINFQAIRQNEHLADDITGPIYAPRNGLILMPLYQSKGSDGFFIVEPLEDAQGV